MIRIEELIAADAATLPAILQPGQAEVVICRRSPGRSQPPLGPDECSRKAQETSSRQKQPGRRDRAKHRQDDDKHDADNDRGKARGCQPKRVPVQLSFGFPQFGQPAGIFGMGVHGLNDLTKSESKSLPSSAKPGEGGKTTIPG